MGIKDTLRDTGQKAVNSVKAVAEYRPEFTVTITDPERVSKVANTIATDLVKGRTFKYEEDKTAYIALLSQEINSNPIAYVNSTVAKASRALDGAADSAVVKGIKKLVEIILP